MPVEKNPVRDYLPGILVVLALALYLTGINWGIPSFTAADRCHAWGNDDEVPLAPLAEMHNTFVLAKADRNIAYPWFHYFLVASAYSPYLAYLVLTARLKHPSGAFPFGLQDPPGAFLVLTWIGRSVTLLLALCTVVGSYYTAKYLWSRKAGFIAALFTLLTFPMVYYARGGNLDVPVLGWTSMGLAAFALCLRQGLTVKRGAWLGAFVALAGATKSQAGGSFLFLPWFVLYAHFRNFYKSRTAQSTRWQEAWEAPAALALSFLLVFIFANGIPVDPLRFIQHVRRLAVVSVESVYLRYPATFAGYTTQAHDLFKYLLDVMSLPGFLLALAGILLALRRDRQSLVLALSSVGFFLMLIPVRFSNMHHLLGVALPLNAFAGYALAAGLSAGKVPRALASLAAIGTLGFQFLLAVDLTHDMLYDSRYAARDWFAANARPGDRVLYFAKKHFQPPLAASVEGIKCEFQAEAVPDLAAKPEFILIVPSDTNEHRAHVEWRTGPHSIYSDFIPADLYRRLAAGELGYQLVARFQTPRLMPWLPRPFISYPVVNIPIHIYLRDDRAAGFPHLTPWAQAPYYPKSFRVETLTAERLRMFTGTATTGDPATRIPPK